MQKLGGLGAAILFVIVGAGLAYHSGYWISLFGYYMTGVTWCAVMLAVGFLFTRRDCALG